MTPDINKFFDQRIFSMHLQPCKFLAGFRVASLLHYSSSRCVGTAAVCGLDKANLVTGGLATGQDCTNSVNIPGCLSPGRKAPSYLNPSLFPDHCAERFGIGGFFTSSGLRLFGSYVEIAL